MQNIKPLKDEMMSWIKEFTKLPHRRTGTPEGRMSAEYVKHVFEDFKLEDVEIETAKSICHETTLCNLTVNNKEVECLLANGTNRFDETGEFSSLIEDAELVYLGKGLEEDFKDVDVAGKIVLCDVYFHSHTHKDTKCYAKYDPDDKLSRPRNLYNIYAPNNWPFNYIYAKQKGAVGFIGILHNFMDCNYYHEDYTYIVDTEGYMKIPAVWVSKKDGNNLKIEIEEKKHSRADLKIKTIYEYRDALNVKGVLKGMSDDIIVIHSHHDAMGTGAVQDASGMSEVFSLIKYFKSLPISERKTTIMFLSTDSHYTDYEGHDKFLDKRAEVGDNIIMDFAVEHIAREMELDVDNEMIIYDEPETRILYVTNINDMPKKVYEILDEYRLDPTLIFAVENSKSEGYDPEEVCSDAYCFHERGIPVISLLSAPMYLFHNSDSVDKVHEDSLVPVSRAYTAFVKMFWETI